MNGLTLRQIGLLTAVGALLAIGQVLFKLAAKSTLPVIDFTSLVKLIINPIALPAVGIYFFTTVLWLYLLQQVPLSRAYPFTTGLGLVLVPLAGVIVFGESTPGRHIIGIVVVLLTQNFHQAQIDIDDSVARAR